MRGIFLRCVGAGSAPPAGMMCPAGRCGAYRRRGVGIAPHGRRREVSPPRQGSAGPRERPADGGAETTRKHGGKPARSVRVVGGFPHGMHPRRAKDSKTIGFGGVLWVLSAAVGRKCPAGGNNRGMRIATASVRTGFAMTPFARSTVQVRDGGV